jgi:hypothetical protein
MTGLLLLLGLALGPLGLGVLTPNVLSFLDPAMPVALALLGVLVGLRAGAPRRAEGGRQLLAGCARAAVTAATIGAAVLLVAPRWLTLEGVPYWFLPIVLGMCGASSSIVAPIADRDQRSPEPDDLDDVLPIVLGGIMLAALREPVPATAALLVVGFCAIVLIVVAIGWLLLARSVSDTEQRVFAVAVLLLLGGAADYLALSGLLGGLAAGILIRRIGGPTQESMRRHVRYVQHPLIVLLVVVVGATVEISSTWLALGAVYLLTRVLGKLIGDWMADRVAGPQIAHSRLSWLSPGVIGIAFALNALRAAGPEAAPVLTAVVAGTIGSEALAMILRPAGVMPNTPLEEVA